MREVKKTLSLLLLVLPTIAGLLYYHHLPDELTHEFEPIRLSEPESIDQSVEVEFRGRKYIFSVRFLEKDQELKGRNGIALRVDHWSKKLWYKPRLLDSEGISPRVQQKVTNLDGKVSMDSFELGEQVRSASSGNYIESKYLVYEFEDFPDTIVPVIQIGKQ